MIRKGNRHGVVLLLGAFLALTGCAASSPKQAQTPPGWERMNTCDRTRYVRREIENNLMVVLSSPTVSQSQALAGAAGHFDPFPQANAQRQAHVQQTQQIIAQLRQREAEVCR